MAVSERFEGANTVEAGRLSPYWGEHAARYAFAAPEVDGKLVLDIACGTGYGLSLLRRSARYVVGADISAEAANAALKECGQNAAVILGNGLGLPFKNGLFDVVTSFETLEHLHERTAFLRELRRVLRPGGQLILSTPNADYSRPVNGRPSNPFHVFEYTPEELRSEIEQFFEIRNFLFQSLDAAIRISPFYEGQKRLPGDLGTQAMLFGWKVFNKIPFAIRESLSSAIWGKPFYPTESDYIFSSTDTGNAPTLVVVGQKRS